MCLSLHHILGTVVQSSDGHKNSVVENGAWQCCSVFLQWSRHRPVILCTLTPLQCLRAHVDPSRCIFSGIYPFELRPFMPVMLGPLAIDSLSQPSATWDCQGMRSDGDNAQFVGKQRISNGMRVEPLTDLMSDFVVLTLGVTLDFRNCHPFTATPLGRPRTSSWLEMGYT